MKKLTLTKESVRQLTAVEAEGVVAGDMHFTTTAQPTRATCPSIQQACPTTTVQKTFAC